MAHGTTAQDQGGFSPVDAGRRRRPARLPRRPAAMGPGGAFGDCDPQAMLVNDFVAWSKVMTSTDCVHWSSRVTLRLLDAGLGRIDPPHCFRRDRWGFVRRAHELREPPTRQLAPGSTRAARHRPFALHSRTFGRRACANSPRYCARCAGHVAC